MKLDYAPKPPTKHGKLFALLLTVAVGLLLLTCASYLIGALGTSSLNRMYSVILPPPHPQKPIATSQPRNVP